MNERIVNQGSTIRPQWVVLSSDMRTVEYKGENTAYIGDNSFDNCVKYLKNQCPTGGCDD